ncbi:MAG TPA: Rossmann-like and DUF2520 domain-containing protein [Candidatus Dormibacteraeota bacterium]|nr:Rossmann-like and DUF2520 domain-containing protein [Candidatus Dormibacteraeota bacterium]
MTETERAPRAALVPQAAERTRVELGLVGAGRAGWALGVSLRAAGWPVTAVASSRLPAARRLAGAVGAVALPRAEAVLTRAAATWLCVPDDALAPLAAAAADRLAPGALRGRVVLHTSGRHGREVLAPLRGRGAAVGSLHPLAALARPDPELLRGAVMALDADPGAEPVATALAVALGATPLAIPESARVLYHAAAVLAGNFPLVLLRLAEELLVEAGVGEAGPGLRTLLQGAAANAVALGPAAALTGPAARGDRGTAAAHLAALAAVDPALARLYEACSALAVPADALRGVA